MRTILLMAGGHRTILDGLSVTDVEHALREGRERGHQFEYFQATNLGDNGIAVDPHQVVAVVAGSA